VITRLAHIGHETINNLTTKKVVYSSGVQNVGIAKDHQNDQVFTQGPLAFLGGEYNESSESFGTNENNMASLPNLKDIFQGEAPPIGHNNWHEKECDLLDLEGVFLAKSHVMAFDPRKVIMDVILEMIMLASSFWRHLSNKVKTWLGGSCLSF
jgi:hypothetical protein